MDYLQYIKIHCNNRSSSWCLVLNLVINGLPSIQGNEQGFELHDISFKPCYKWITFNTASWNG